MSLQSLTFEGARFRAGRWRGYRDLAYLVPLSPAHTLTVSVLAQARAELGTQGFDEVVTAAVGPPERAAFVRDGFVEREHLHLLHHPLTGLPPRQWSWRRRESVRVERGAGVDRGGILELDARTFDEFWCLDGAGLDDAMDATPGSRMRVVRGERIIGYSVAGRAGAQGFLQRVAVDPDHEGCGIGRALVYDALRWMRGQGANVGWVNTQEANERARCLYEHLGYRPANHNLTVLARTIQ